MEIGYWIETYTQNQTAEALIQQHRGQLIRSPSSFMDIPADKALIAVCFCIPIQEEGAFLIFDEAGLASFQSSLELSQKKYLLVDAHVGHNLANYHPA